MTFIFLSRNDENLLVTEPEIDKMTFEGFSDHFGLIFKINFAREPQKPKTKKIIDQKNMDQERFRYLLHYVNLEENLHKLFDSLMSQSACFNYKDLKDDKGLVSIEFMS